MFNNTIQFFDAKVKEMRSSLICRVGTTYRLLLESHKIHIIATIVIKS